MDNIEVIKINCEEFSKNRKGKDILRLADGKNSYKKIAAKLNVHPTTVSSLLKKAERLSLAKKISVGIYKKNSGILGYIPEKNIDHNPKRTVGALVRKIDTVRRSKQKGMPVSSFLLQANVIASIDKMTEAYRILYSVENILRGLIREVFKDENNWWSARVPKGIQDAVAETSADIPYHASSRSDELEYTHLGHLKEIIINSKNWNLFLPYLKTKDKNDFSATIDKAIPSRNAIGHCIPLKKSDLDIVKVRMRDIINMIIT